MAVNAARVLIGAPDQSATGAILSAPIGTPLPTDASIELDEAFVSAGYVSEDGVTLTPDISTSDIKEWGGAVVRRVLDQFSGTIAWSYIQFDADAARQAFGDDNVVVTPATSGHGEQVAIKIKAVLPPVKSWVIKVKDGDYLIRIVVPSGQVSSYDDIAFTISDPVPFPVTLSCYPDEDGVSIYIYGDDGKLLGTGVTP